ncbi:MAG: DNA polymerase I [Oscillospiraceae bacterium]|nr:DNA polymerase I [Oscillospiraceae bacterium]
MKNILIIDGNSILNRAFYAINPLTTKNGLCTNAVYGFLNILLKHIETLNPDYGAVAFDLPAPTFRHEKYDGYKATRKGMPDELAVQLPYAKKCVELLGLKVLQKPGYEADDIIGTVANFAEDDTHSYILTGDRDSLQLICENISVLLASNSDTVKYDAEKFKADYGIDPSVFVDVKALMGDSSDNIPGVAGIGEKTALKLISLFNNLDNLYDEIESDTTVTNSIKTKIITGKENAYLSRFLAKIDTEVPLEITLDDIIRKEYDRHGLLEIFNELEFTAMIKRLNLASDVETVTYNKINAAELPKDGIITAEIKNNTLFVVADEGNFSVQYETLSELKDFFESGINVYDSKYFYTLLANEGIKFNCNFDVMLAAYVSNSTDNSYDITRLSAAYLNTTSEDSTYTTHKLYNVLNEKLRADNQYDLYKNIELPLAAVLSEMEIYGFKVDRFGLVNYANKLQQYIDECSQQVFKFAGEEFNINSPKQLGELLFEKLDLPTFKKKKTGYSTEAEVLEKLRPYSPIIDHILEFRQVSKLKSTYADGLLKVADQNGRIHTTFNQTVTATGRLSSTEPNLQNIPIRQPQGRELRKFFIPESHDYVLIDADYSQIELRLLADISGDRIMTQAFVNGDDIHAITASQVFDVPIENVTPEMRKRAKAVNFGIIYGIGDFSLAADIGVTKYQAGEYIKSYLEKYADVDRYLKNTVAEAYELGYVTTRFGRRRYIPELKSAKAPIRSFGERVAMNSPIQGTAADIIKIAMINTSAELKKAGIDARLILQVHDELVVESHKDCREESCAILKRCMEDIPGFKIPLTVDVSYGDTWFK